MWPFFKTKIQKKASQLGFALFERALNTAQTWAPEVFTLPSEEEEAALSDWAKSQQREKRFEVIALVVSVFLWRLKHEKTACGALVAQELHDHMFLSFDRSLRENGVGDVGVSHRIKRYAQAFYGRLQRYSLAFDGAAENTLATLAEGVAINMQILPQEQQVFLVQQAFALQQALQTENILGEG